MIREKTDFDLTRFNTFRLPMMAARFVEYDDTADLATLFGSGAFASPWLHLGGGSNLLFATARYEGLVLHRAYRGDNPLTGLREGDEPQLVVAPAAIDLDQLAEMTAQMGLYGLENLSGIPGQLGAGVVQNVGAYGVELGQIVDSVETFDTQNGTVGWISADDCAFGYRTSAFKNGGPLQGRCIVTAVKLRLSRSASPVLTYGSLAALAPDASPMTVREAVLDIRRSKLPDVEAYGSAGSYFKNPVVDASAYARACSMSGLEIPSHTTADGRHKLSAAWLIDKSGLKGTTEGGAALWPTQPLVIYNRDNATATDVLRLQHHIVDTVLNRFGIELHPEVQRI